ncbi:MAG: IclR family transcriptional regulator [Parvibaculaceae bacterium]
MQPSSLPHAQSDGLEKAVEPPRPRIQSAARSISILLEVARSPNGLRAADIRERLKLPRQVIYHMLHTLLSTGIIRKSVDNRYLLGLAAGLVADGFRRQLAPTEHLAPLVRALASETGETAYASGWLDGQIVTLASAKGYAPVHAGEPPLGYSEHPHSRASGKLLLALGGVTLAEEFLKREKLVARTPDTITSRKRLLEEFETIRRQRYAVDNQEFSQGLCCLAVPLAGSGDTCAIGLSAPTERFAENRERYLQILQKRAEADGQHGVR